MKYQQFIQYAYDILEPKEYPRLKISEENFQIMKKCFDNCIHPNNFPPAVASKAWEYYKQYLRK